MKNIFKILCLCVVIITAFVGCKAEKPQDTGFPVTAAGVTLDKKPERVVCLTQGAVEAVKYFAGESVIANKKQDISADEIISLSPDIVFSNEPLPEGDSQKLELAGVKVAILSVPVYMNELEAYYSAFASLLFGTVEAEGKVSNALRELDVLTLEEAAYTALLIPHKDTVATPDTIMGRLLSCAGYKNAAEGLNNFAMVDWTATQAQVIFCGVGMKQQLIADPIISKTPAVLNGMVYEIDTDALRLPGNRFAQVIEDMKSAVIATSLVGDQTSSMGE